VEKMFIIFIKNYMCITEFLCDMFRSVPNRAKGVAQTEVEQECNFTRAKGGRQQQPAPTGASEPWKKCMYSLILLML